jgi:hypothetical protein
VGIRLIVEVLDHWQDFGLTSGERGDLIVIAEHTNDATRETVVSIHKAYMLQRAGKSAAGWKNAIGKLMKKGVLEHAVRNGRRVTGHENQAAQYRIPHLCPTQSHDGLWGQCKRVTSQVTHSGDEPNQEGHPSDDPLGQEGHLSGAKRVTSQVGEGHLSGDPYPSSPSVPSTTSSKSEPAANGQQRKSNPPASGPIPGDAPHLDDVEAICNHLADAIQKLTNERPTITKRDWRDPARLLLDKDGRTFEQILTAIDWAHADDFWQGVITSPKALRSNYAKLRQKAAAERRKPRAFQNPDDQDVYDEDIL